MVVVIVVIGVVLMCLRQGIDGLPEYRLLFF